MKISAQAFAAAAVSNELLGADTSSNVPLGLDAHAVRGMRWNADEILAYGAALKVDAVLFNTLSYYQSLDDDYLLKLRAAADANDIRIYVGAGGISEGSTIFKNTYGNAMQSLATAIRVAKILGSPVVNCRIGNIDDRFSEGGITARMEEVINVMKASRSKAEDAGIKLAFENHAGDTRTEEVLTIINEVGPDLCGSMLDPGNAVWAMEDPMMQIKKLAPHVLCTSVRDWQVWESEGGASFQWTSIGNGLMDAPEFARILRKSSPGVPLFVETISNSLRPLPFLTDEHLAAYPDLKVTDIADFLRMLRRGTPLELATPPEGMSQSEFDQQHQKAELLRSYAYLRKHCKVGRKA